MPRVKRDFSFALAGGLKAFLRLDAGAGRGVVPASDEEQLRSTLRRLEKEKSKRRRAESRLRQLGDDGATTPAVAERATPSRSPTRP